MWVEGYSNSLCVWYHKVANYFKIATTVQRVGKTVSDVQRQDEKNTLVQENKGINRYSTKYQEDNIIHIMSTTLFAA